MVAPGNISLYSARVSPLCCATIKVRNPDNQDEKVVALLVSQGGRSPPGGASSATTSLSFR